MSLGAAVVTLVLCMNRMDESTCTRLPVASMQSCTAALRLWGLRVNEWSYRHRFVLRGQPIGGCS